LSNYIVTTDFAAKDALPSGNPGKVAQGTQIDVELDNIATAIATKEDTANKGTANGYAGLDSSGDVPKAQLPASVAYEDEANTFTNTLTMSASSIRINSLGGAIWLFQTDAAANNGKWLIDHDSEEFNIYLVNDAENSFTSLLRVTRTNNTIDSIQMNGQTVWTAGTDGAGSGCDADLLDGQQGSFYQSASNLNAGTLADARVAATNVTQHLVGGLALQISGRNVTGKSGTTKTLSTSAPSGGSDGDIWYRY
jgi:hypothetical protein